MDGWMGANIKYWMDGWRKYKMMDGWRKYKMIDGWLKKMFMKF